MPSTLPGLPTREAGWVLQQMDKKLKGFPEVERVFGKLGRADTSTDPAPVSMVETTILLKPRSQWRKGMTKSKLVAEMDQTMNIIGYVNTWVQPIRARVMMQSTGIQTPVGIKVKGDDIAVIESTSQQIETLLRSLPGTKSVIAERISEGYYIDVQNDLERMSEQGVTVSEAMDTVRYAIGGDNIVGVKQADNTIIPLGLQYSPEYIDTVEKVKNSPVITADGRSVPIGQIANVSVRKLPEMIRNDNGQLAGYIYVDLQNMTASDYVEKAKAFLAQNLTLPQGYSLEWTGLYQYTEAARGRLKFIVPLTLVIIFGLLLLAFRSRGRDLPHHALCTVRDGRRGVLSMDSRIRHDDCSHCGIHLSVCHCRSDGHHHGHLHTGIAGESHRIRNLYRCRHARFHVATETQTDDGRGSHSLIAADCIFHAAGNGHPEANRGAQYRRNGDVDHPRAVHDPMSVRDRRRLSKFEIRT